MSGETRIASCLPKLLIMLRHHLLPSDPLSLPTSHTFLTHLWEAACNDVINILSLSFTASPSATTSYLQHTRSKPPFGP